MLPILKSTERVDPPFDQYWTLSDGHRQDVARFRGLHSYLEVDEQRPDIERFVRALPRPMLARRARLDDGRRRRATA